MDEVSRHEGCRARPDGLYPGADSNRPLAREHEVDFGLAVAVLRERRAGRYLRHTHGQNLAAGRVPVDERLVEDGGWTDRLLALHRLPPTFVLAYHDGLRFQPITACCRNLRLRPGQEALLP